MKKGFLLKKTKAKQRPAAAAAPVNNETEPASSTASAARTPQVYIVGDAGVRTETLTSAVHQIAGTPEERREGRSSVLQLATKYYTADIEFVQQELVFEDTQNAAQDAPIVNDDGVEAIILVVSAKSPSTFSAVTRHWEGALARGKKFPQLSVQLITVLAEGGEGAVSDSFLDKVFDWASTAFFECIVCDVKEPLKGSEGRDRESFGRVLQALEAHMWSNLQMRPRGRPSVTNSAPVTATLETQSVNDSETTSRTEGTDDDGRIDTEPDRADDSAGAEQSAEENVELPAPKLAEPQIDDEEESQRRLREFLGDDLLESTKEAFGDDDGVFSKLVEQVHREFCHFNR